MSSFFGFGLRSQKPVFRIWSNQHVDLLWKHLWQFHIFHPEEVRSSSAEDFARQCGYCTWHGTVTSLYNALPRRDRGMKMGPKVAQKIRHTIRTSLYNATHSQKPQDETFDCSPSDTVPMKCHRKRFWQWHHVTRFRVFGWARGDVIFF